MSSKFDSRFVFDRIRLSWSLGLVMFLATSVYLYSDLNAQSTRIATQFVRNLNISTSLGPEISGDLIAFVVSEYSEGGTDLNGDGDATDYVLHIHNVRSRTTRSLGFASTAFHLDGHILAFLVHENSQGAIDLNGDGDAFDQVAFVYDARSETVTNLGITTGPESFGPIVRGNLISIAVDEHFQGATDLNNDGDADDLFVLHIHDVSTGLTTNLGLATGFITLLGESSQVAFPVSEYNQGQTDLNGDNDFLDAVMHIYDSRSGDIVNIGIAVSYSVPRTHGTRVLFGVHEVSAGNTDLNGDGDISDQVAFLYDGDTGQLDNLGLAVFGNDMDLSGNVVVIPVDEQDQGETDLNGDGDTLDRVDHVYNLQTGQTTNLGLSSAGFLLENGRLAFRVWESGQGFTDLNGDGDSSDVILHLYNSRNGRTSNLGIATEFDVQFAGNLLAFRVSETSQGGEDLNGDNDILDTVVHTYNIRSGLIVNQQLATYSNALQIDQDRIAIKVDEATHFSADLNRDGDANDKVLHALNLKTNSLINLRRAADQFRISNNVITFSVPEIRQGNSDLNNDGDSDDRVLHLFKGF